MQDPATSSLIATVLFYFLLGLVAAEIANRIKSYIKKRRET